MSKTPKNKTKSTRESPTSSQSKTPAEKDARIKALVNSYVAKGGPITKEQLTNEVVAWLRNPLWLANHGKAVESHETPVGETQTKEVVTDETQAVKPTTVRGWLETIPDEKIREAALRYCSSTDAAKECTVLYAAIDIVTSPRWKEEGSKFWHECMDADYYRKPWPAYPEKAKQEADSVSHPSHYTSHPSGVECITITKHMNFCRGNAMKYLWRAGQKGDSLEKEIEDIAKAEEYCRVEKERLIAKKGAK